MPLKLMLAALVHLLSRSSALIGRTRGTLHRPASLRSRGHSIPPRRRSPTTSVRLPTSKAALASFMKAPRPSTESGGVRHRKGGPKPITVTGAPGSLERLCRVTLRACQLMTPFVAAVYEHLQAVSKDGVGGDEESNVQKLKGDDSAFTIADGVVQRLLVEVLFSRVTFRDIVGEEERQGADVREDNSAEGWFRIEGLTIPPALRPLLVSVRSEIDALAAACLSSEPCEGDRNDYRHVTVFIDPIDGTKEFSSGKGEQCSICVGFANERGRAVGGVIHRMLSRPAPTWVAGARSEGFALCDFGEGESSVADRIDCDDTDNIAGGSLLTSNGSISGFLQALNEELDFVRVRSGGAGNKIMMLLQNSISGNNENMLYIQDRGVSRWDSCAAEACLESFGGKLMKLTHWTETKQDAREEETKDRSKYYTYLTGPDNLDFIPGRADLTKYNRRRPTSDIDLRHRQKALRVDQVKPYANMCGLVAFGKEWNTKERVMHIKEAIARAAMRNPPSFN